MNSGHHQQNQQQQQQHQQQANLSRSSSNMQSNSAVAGTSTNGTISGSNNPSAGSDLQQAILQSMASSRNTQSHPSALFGGNHHRSSSAGSSSGLAGMNMSSSPSGLSSAQLNIVQQVLGSMGGSSQQHQQAQQQQQQQHQQSNQGSIISQLVASLQAQQQAQQQAQVQAAIARAFGPSVGGGGGARLSANAAAAAPSAHDLLSRMQLAQAVQSAAHNAGGSNSQVSRAPNGGASTGASSNANNTDVTKAGADDLIKLQLEQERHNRMIQLAQADRQERAMLANQEALLKKHHRIMSKGQGNGSGMNQGLDEDIGEFNFTFSKFVLLSFSPTNFLINFNLFLHQTTSAMHNNNSSVGNNIFSAAAGFTNPLLSNAAASSSFAPKISGLMNPHPNGTAASASAMLGNEADLQQKLGAARGAVIVPCRARGMPVDHNFKTAYFVIPDGIEHGDELMCSYPACRQAGVKFRYCLHCKVPVAKRNFRNRHRHGVPGGEGGSVSGDEGEEDDISSEEEDNNEAECNLKTEGSAENETNSNTQGCTAPVCMPTMEHNPNSNATPQREHLIVIPADNMKKKKKKSNNARVPCRARGMPMAHNFKTAYFTIPQTVQHGDELVCSFPSCRSAGAKFRYCLHCKVPVAKRNFRNRHKHGNIGDKKKAAIQSPSDTPNEAPQAKKEEEDMPQEEDYAVGHADDDDEGEDQHQSDEGNKHDEDDDEEEEELKPSSKTTIEVPDKPQPAQKDETTEIQNNNQASNMKEEERPQCTDSSEAKATVEINSSHDANQVQKWVSLLESKPDPSDKHAMAVWMLNLMNATENPASAAAAAVQVEPTPAPTQKRESSKDDEASEGSTSSMPPKKKFKQYCEEV